MKVQLDNPKAPRYFFKELDHKLANHRSPGGLLSVSTHTSAWVIPIPAVKFLLCLGTWSAAQFSHL